ncbi:hypothetical protein TIFTF001_035087 [Ficus carica]|uniref:Uncharacterized protein n=1 Tax=Ficus carica TaxID=3494 RepID=A0AA88E4X4_FICCA|nr:hypothetical protein TIFTF001_035087 [Ficus carica]
MLQQSLQQAVAEADKKRQLALLQQEEYNSYFVGTIFFYLSWESVFVVFGDRGKALVSSSPKVVFDHASFARRCVMGDRRPLKPHKLTGWGGSVFKENMCYMCLGILHPRAVTFGLRSGSGCGRRSMVGVGFWDKDKFRMGFLDRGQVSRHGLESGLGFQPRPRIRVGFQGRCHGRDQVSEPGLELATVFRIEVEIGISVRVGFGTRVDVEFREPGVRVRRRSVSGFGYHRLRTGIVLYYRGLWLWLGSRSSFKIRDSVNFLDWGQGQVLGPGLASGFGTTVKVECHDGVRVEFRGVEFGGIEFAGPVPEHGAACSGAAPRDAFHLKHVFSPYAIFLWPNQPKAPSPSINTDANHSTTSRDLVQVPIGPVMRARAKKFKDVLNGLIQEVWTQANSRRPIELSPRV